MCQNGNKYKKRVVDLLSTLRHLALNTENLFVYKMCKKENHSRNRDKVCISCLLKADRGRASDLALEQFRKNWLAQYDEENPFSPTGICSSCHARLFASHDHGKEPKMFISDYSQILPSKCMFANFVCGRNVRLFDAHLFLC